MLGEDVGPAPAERVVSPPIVRRADAADLVRNLERQYAALLEAQAEENRYLRKLLAQGGESLGAENARLRRRLAELGARAPPDPLSPLLSPTARIEEATQLADKEACDAWRSRCAELEQVQLRIETAEAPFLEEHQEQLREALNAALAALRQEVGRRELAERRLLIVQARMSQPPSPTRAELERQVGDLEDALALLRSGPARASPRNEDAEVQRWKARAEDLSQQVRFLENELAARARLPPRTRDLTESPHKTPRSFPPSPGLATFARDLSAAIDVSPAARRPPSPGDSRDLMWIHNRTSDLLAPVSLAPGAGAESDASSDEEWLDEGVCETDLLGRGWVRVHAHVSAEAIVVAPADGPSQRLDLAAARRVKVAGRELQAELAERTWRLRFVSERKADQWLQIIAREHPSAIEKEPSGVSALASALSAR